MVLRRSLRRPLPRMAGVLVCLLALLMAAAPPGMVRAAAPTLTLDPDHGLCDDRVVARGSGFPVGSAIVLQRDADNGPALARATVGDDGAFAVAFTLACGESVAGGTALTIVAGPDKAGGPATGSARASATFTVQAVAGDAAWAAVRRGATPAERPIYRPTWLPERFGGTAQFTVNPSYGAFYRTAAGERLIFASGDLFGRAPDPAPVGAVPVRVHGLPGYLIETAEPATIAVGWAEAGGTYVVRDEQRTGGMPLGSGELLQVVDSLAPVGADGTVAPRCFAETGRCVDGRFLAYWLAHGGLALNGYPLGDAGFETLEDGRAYTVQYFERTRLEYHPENAAPDDVLLGQLGRAIHPAPPPAAPLAEARYFAETGHNLRAGFRAYWEANGGLAQFGYPLTEEFPAQLEDGKTYTVQYFERARFEYHPENPAPDDVLLGQFGRRLFATSFLAPFPGQPPTCRAADLEGSAGYGVGTGSAGGVIALTNRGAAPCAFSGTPRVEVVDDAGRALAAPVARQDVPVRCSGGPQAPGPCPAQWALAVPPGSQATAFWNLFNYCAPPDAPPLSFRVTLPDDGGQFTAHIADADGHRLTGTRCDAPGQAAELLVEPLAFEAGREPAFGALQTYFGFLNLHGYREAYAMLSPALQARQSYGDFVAGFADTARDTVAVEMIAPTGDRRWTATVRLAARQTDGTVRYFRGTYEVAQVAAGGDAPPGTLVERLTGASIAPE